MNDGLLQLFDALKYGTDYSHSVLALAQQISTKHGYSTPFEIVFKNLSYDQNLDQYDIIIMPGNPVQIILSDRYTYSCILVRRDPYYFKTRLTQALDRMHRAHRTLKHPVSMKVVWALKHEAKAWAKIPAPVFEERILHSKYLEVEYTVRVKDKITQTVVELNGDNPVELKRDAIKRLSSIIYDCEDLMDMFEQYEDMIKFKPEHKPEIIKLGGTDGEIRDAREY